MKTVLILIASLLSSCATTNPANRQKAMRKVRWTPTIQNELETSDKVGLIFVYADWCATCQVLKRAVEGAEDHLAENRITVYMADFTKGDPGVKAFLVGCKRAGVPFTVLMIRGKAHVTPDLYSTQSLINFIDKRLKR